MKMLTQTNTFRNFWRTLRTGLWECRSRLKALLPYAIVSKAQLVDMVMRVTWAESELADANQRWTDLNALMAHRAQQERGAVIVRQRGKRLNILATKTSPAGYWEISVE